MQHERAERIDIEALRDEAAGALAGAVELRRTLHRWPEVGNHLPITQEQVLAAIEPLPLDVTVHETTSGIAALLTGGKPGPDRAAARRHGRPAAPRGHRARLRVETRRPDARLRPRHPHGDARRRRPAARPNAPATSPAGCCSCSSRARRASTAPGSCSTRGCSTSRRSPTARRRRSPARSPCTSPRSLPAGWLTCRGGPTMASADTLLDHDHRQGRPRQRAVPGHRPDPRRVRDRAGAADDGDAHDRRVRPGASSPSGGSPPARPTTSSPRRPTSRARSGPSARRPAAGSTTTSAASPRASPPPTASTATVDDRDRLSGHGQRRCVRRQRARRSPSSSPGPTTWSSCPTRSWAPRTSATCCSACPAR